jgi:predicted O-methyltransferase YrrM
MEKIREYYEYSKSTPSDINEHLPTLLKYSEECKHITELGVRGGVSSWALLYSNPEKMVAYDIASNPSVENIINVANESNLNFHFILKDVLTVEIENTDLLFIDTWHTYNQLSSELQLHSNNVNKYIILHDTVSFGFIDESLYDYVSNIVKQIPQEKVGLVNAVQDFLITEKGYNWEIHDVYENNNGLTVLKRKN